MKQPRHACPKGLCRCSYLGAYISLTTTRLVVVVGSVKMMCVRYDNIVYMSSSSRRGGGETRLTHTRTCHVLRTDQKRAHPHLLLLDHGNAESSKMITAASTAARGRHSSRRPPWVPPTASARPGRRHRDMAFLASPTTTLRGVAWHRHQQWEPLYLPTAML